MGKALDELKGFPPGKGRRGSLKAVPAGADVNGAGDTVPILRPQPATYQMKTTLRNRLSGLLRRNGLSSVPPALVSVDAADPWDEFRRELERSRRYERTFVLVRVPWPAAGGRHGSGEEARTAPRDAAFEEMVQIAAFLRSVDRAWIADESIYVLLPECDRPMGEAFLARVRRLAPELLPDEGVSLVEFPLDGSTSGALLAKLRGQPLSGTPRDVASMRTPHLREIDLRAQQTGETT